MEIRPALQNYITLAQQPSSPPPTAENAIAVSAATKRIATAYERFRNVLEPAEEDILRRNAIWRILLRRVPEDHPTATTNSPHSAATALLQEMMRANYIKAAAHETAIHIAHKIAILRYLKERVDAKIFTWLLHVAAVAIDRDIFPRQHDEALVHLFYHDTYHRVVWTDNLVAEADRPAQLFVACHRALFTPDDYEIIYHYFRHRFPSWQTTGDVSEKDMDEIARHLPDFYNDVQKIIYHPARQRLLTLLRPVAVPYRLLRDVIPTASAETLADREQLATLSQGALGKRGDITLQRINRRAWHSVLFLLVTKSLLALAIEVPYERFFLKQVHWGAIAANTLFHPILLFIFSGAVRLPGKDNTEKVVDQVQKIVSGDGELPTVLMNAPRRYGPFTWTIFGIIYTILFIGIFWGLSLFLDSLGFSLLAIVLFVFFLGLVSFFALRNRRAVEDLRVVPKREGAFSAMISFLILPILEFGSWLASHLSQVNFPLFLMDRIFEAPFKLLIDVAEEWFVFVRERREEIV